MSDIRHLQVWTTAASEEEALRIADALVEARLAACVQIESSIQSVYRWEGKVQHDTEYRLSIKTLVERYNDVEAKILQLHSYDQPEVIAIPIARGNQGYLAWIDEQVAE